LDFVSNPVFSAHCEFLQMFPTINFYTAAEILCNCRICELPRLQPRDINAFVCFAAPNAIEIFCALLHLDTNNDYNLAQRDLGNDFHSDAHETPLKVNKTSLKDRQLVYDPTDILEDGQTVISLFSLCSSHIFSQVMDLCIFRNYLGGNHNCKIAYTVA
jgi:hypothetical protein